MATVGKSVSLVKCLCKFYDVWDLCSPASVCFVAVAYKDRHFSLPPTHSSPCQSAAGKQLFHAYCTFEVSTNITEQESISPVFALYDPLFWASCISANRLQLQFLMSQHFVLWVID